MEGLRADVARLALRVVGARLDRDRDGLLGADHHIPLRLAHSYAYTFMDCTNSSRDELIFAEKLLEDAARRLRRVLGISHPGTANAEGDLAILRRRIAKL